MGVCGVAGLGKVKVVQLWQPPLPLDSWQLACHYCAVAARDVVGLSHSTVVQQWHIGRTINTGMQPCLAISLTLSICPSAFSLLLSLTPPPTRPCQLLAAPLTWSPTMTTLAPPTPGPSTCLWPQSPSTSVVCLVTQLATAPCPSSASTASLSASALVQD